jgi:hypothetical protein
MESLKRQALECTQLEEQVLTQTAFLMEKEVADNEHNERIERWKDIAVHTIQQRAVEIDIALEQEREVVFPRLRQVCKEINMLDIMFNQCNGVKLQKLFDAAIVSEHIIRIEILLDMDSTILFGLTALILAIESGKLELLNRMLETPTIREELDNENIWVHYSRASTEIACHLLYKAIDINNSEIVRRLFSLNIFPKEKYIALDHAGMAIVHCDDDIILNDILNLTSPIIDFNYFQLLLQEARYSGKLYMVKRVLQLPHATSDFLQLYLKNNSTISPEMKLLFTSHPRYTP